MATKTNYEVNGKKYFRISASFGKDCKGKLIRKYFYGKSEKEAKKKLEEYKFNLRNGIDISNKLLFYPFMKEWLYETVRNNVKASTFDRYEDIFRNYVQNSKLANKDIKEIRSIHIQKYYNELFSAGKTTSRITAINKLIRSFYNYCLNEGYLVRNPCLNVNIPINKQLTSKKEIEVFNENDLNKILNSDYSFLIKDISVIALATGMRAGEILGLTEYDLDEKNSLIHINKIVATYTDIDSNGNRHKVKRIQTPKTNNSIRDIPYPKELRAIFKDAIRKRNENKLKYSKLYNNDYLKEKFIFLTDEGNLIYGSNLNKSWKFFLNNLNIPYKKFHTLRHTYATLQFRNNTKLKTVSKLLGHSNIRITADTYTHVLKKDMEESVNIINVLKMC